MAVNSANLGVGGYAERAGRESSPALAWLELSPVADALAGLRANEARYFKHKYSHTLPSNLPTTRRRWSTESGLSIKVMYTIAEAGKRTVGFKLSEGMEVPEELATRFKFARQKSKLAGTIRGSFFVIKGEY